MESREAIYDSISKALEGVDETAALPSLDEIASAQSKLVPQSAEIESLVDVFCQRLVETNGIPLRGPMELRAFLKERGVQRPYLDPKVSALLELELPGAVTQYKREAVDEIDCGITLATMGIAETGTLVLQDNETSNRLAALAPWIHIAVLRKEAIVASVLEALKSLGNDPSIIYVTGPSKTADIEGILIEGVHGPGVQACLIV